MINETHDAARRSFVASANAPDSDFPIQNLPFGAFRPSANLPPRVPFGSHQWPTLVTPGSGPASLADLP